MDAEKPPFAHNALTVIEENGKEVKILRDNMPFGRPGHGEVRDLLHRYSRTPRITETMLHNMFVGRPPGNYDHLLDSAKQLPGVYFFAPSSSFLDNISGDAPDSAAIGARQVRTRLRPHPKAIPPTRNPQNRIA